MQLTFTQAEFSWDASYTVRNADGDAVFQVEGTDGPCLRILSADGTPIGEVKKHKFLWSEKIEMHAGKQYIGSVRQEYTFRGPRFIADSTDWSLKGSVLVSRHYKIWSEITKEVASVVRTDGVYTVEIKDPIDALRSVMLVIALDAYLAENERKRRG